MNTPLFFFMLAMCLAAGLVGIGLSYVLFRLRRPVLALALAAVWFVFVVVIMPRIAPGRRPDATRVERTTSKVVFSDQMPFERTRTGCTP